MSRDEWESELTATRVAAAAVLTDIADGVLAGSVRLGDGPDAVVVDTPDELAVEIEFETDEDEASLEVELEWDPADSAAEPTAARDAPVDTTDPAADEQSDADTAGEREIPEQPAADPAVDDTNPAASAVDEVSDAVPVGASDLQSLARFELFRDRADEWRWRLRHRNGNVIATSGEGYTRKHNARKGLRSVVRNAPGAEVHDEGAD